MPAIHPEGSQKKSPPVFSASALSKVPKAAPSLTPSQRYSDAMVNELKGNGGLASARFLTRALLFANLADVAYTSDCSLDFLRIGFLNYRYYDVEGAQGHSACNDTEMIITFRGTEPSAMNDVMADANMASEKYGDGSVHRGFKNECNKLLPGIKKYLLEFPGKFVCAFAKQAAAAAVNTSHRGERRPRADAGPRRHPALSSTVHPWSRVVPPPDLEREGRKPDAEQKRQTLAIATRRHQHQTPIPYIYRSALWNRGAS